MTRDSEGNVQGMYPLDDDEVEEFDTFAELREVAEAASDSLNLPLTWHFQSEKQSWDDDHWQPSFTLMFLTPRRRSSWAVRCAQFDTAEVLAWIDSWLRGEINKWFGWPSDPESETR